MSASFRLCYITDRRALVRESLITRIQTAVKAGVDLIQIREKDLATRPLLELARQAVASAHAALTRVVLNDRLDAALAAEADGVHLGGQSLPPAAVRKMTPKDFLVGVSCHSLQEASAAESAGADYILLGPIFETPSKAGYGLPLGLAKLAEAAARVKIPLLALGGICPERARPCLQAGASGIAGIRIFQDCDSLATRVRELRALWPPEPA